MNEIKLELRMYFFVPYNILEIQKSIQAGHSALEYAQYFGDSEIFKDFVKNWKTWIILNGGTTNRRRDSMGKAVGTLDQISDQLFENSIQFAYFHEPDLNDALTAVCFICDERVFNKKEYPDLKNFILKDVEVGHDRLKIHVMNDETIKTNYPIEYVEWLEQIGGEQNEFLRELLRDKNLA